MRVGAAASRLLQRAKTGTLGGIVGALFDLLAPELHRRFPGRGLVMVAGEYPHLRFPGIHPEVGDIDIYDYDGDELTVWYGNFTHCHYGDHSATSPETVREAVDAVIADLDALFSDRLRMHGSHEGGGGILREGDEVWFDESNHPQYVWSGPIKDAA